jgi:peptide/nickel transport system ATP-binding protein
MSTLLHVENLSVSFPTAPWWSKWCKGVSFTLGRERLGIVGESGSGKSHDRPRDPGADAHSRQVRAGPA